MNTRPDRPDDSDLERSVRASLAADAGRLRPTDRLDSILDAARSQPGRGAGSATAGSTAMSSSTGRAGVVGPGAGGPGAAGARGGRADAVQEPRKPREPGSTGADRTRPPTRWWPILAAAAVALVAAAVVWLNLPGRSPVPVPATTTSPTTTSVPTATTMPTPTQSSPPPTSAAPTTTGPTPAATTTTGAPATGPTGDSGPRSVAVYRVIPLEATDVSRWGATREFVRVNDAPSSADGAVRQALELAFQTPPELGTTSTWQPADLTSVQVGPDEVRLTLARPLQEPDAARATVAVQAVVLTVQATLQRSDLPVVFTLADGSGQVATGTDAGARITRAADLETSGIAAPIWLDQPARQQSEPAVGTAVTIAGRARVFEATVSWEVVREDGSAVASGHATATVGAPQRGEFRTSWTPTQPGTYVLRVFEQSARDGSAVGTVTRVLTVR